MADPTLSDLLLASLVWVVVIAAGIVIGGLILHRLVRDPGAARQEAAIAERLAALESRLDVHFQDTGGYQGWAALKARERELRGDR